MTVKPARGGVVGRCGGRPPRSRGARPSEVDEREAIVWCGDEAERREGGRCWGALCVREEESNGDGCGRT